MFAKRLIEPELLDHLPAEVAKANLADLVRINERFGGHSVILKTFARLAKRDDRFTVLDIGAASGDTARLIRRTYPHASVTSLDNNVVNLEAARQPKLIANAFALPFPAGSFDYVLCSLFLHHFPDEQVVQLLSSFYAAARNALLVCDLERHVLPYLFLPATRLLLGWNYVTVRDGMVSVRASFRPRELLKLAEDSGVAQPEVAVHRPAFRISLVARK